MAAFPFLLWMRKTAPFRACAESIRHQQQQVVEAARRRRTGRPLAGDRPLSRRGELADGDLPLPPLDEMEESVGLIFRFRRSPQREPSSRPPHAGSSLGGGV